MAQTTASHKARQVLNYDAIKEPGDFAYYVRYGAEIEYGTTPPFVGMIYCCPCGCDSRGSLPFIQYRGDGHSNPQWDWDGNVEKPTLKPSIAHSVGDGKGGMVEHWHGYLTNGEFKSC